MTNDDQEISNKELDQRLEELNESLESDDSKVKTPCEEEREISSRESNVLEEKEEVEDEEVGDKQVRDKEEEDEEISDQEDRDEEVRDKEVRDKEDEYEEVGDQEDGDEDSEDQSVGDKEVGKRYVGDEVVEDEEVEDEEAGNKDVGDEEVGDEEVEDEEVDRRHSRNTTVYDFDIMMAKKKEENSRRRKRRNYDIINDNDDIIADIINQMKDAVEADSDANRNKMAATKKLKLLPFVISQLRKVDLRDAFLDSDVLSVITEWLAPLPDKSLPHLNIRESLLKILIDFNLYDVDRIKSSGIGKAIMYLYKHPKETKENKQRAKQLISCWSRPIFQLDSSFDSISREEREQRDLELMSKKRRSSKQNDGSDNDVPGPSSGTKRTKDDHAQKPGDKGWIPRARVPAPSMRDYVIRPRSKVDGDIGKSSKRPSNMLEKYMKNQQDRRRASRQQRAINMKIDGV